MDEKKLPKLKDKSDSPHAVLEETGTAFDPTTQHVDLTKEEKRRTTALMMAIQAYSNLIIKDADMYIAICRERGGRRDDKDGPMIQPATMNAMVEAALLFDDFISGRLQTVLQEVEETPNPATEPQPLP